MTGQVDFGSHTDAVVAVAAALVNVATPGERRGRRYAAPTGAELEAALASALHSGGRPVSRITKRQVPALVELAREIRPVFEDMQAGRADGAAQTANALLRRYQPVPALEHHDGQPWHLHFHGRVAADTSGWGGGIAVGLATVLGSDNADRLGVCEAPACDRVFVDVSRNGTRRFCSTACQNRVKSAAHRRRALAD